MIPPLSLPRLVLAAPLLVFALVVPEAAPASLQESRIHRFVEQHRTNPPPADAIVFTGSCSIDVWRTLQEYFRDIPAIKRGIGGSGLADLLRLIEHLKFPLKPRFSVIYSGEIDPQRGFYDRVTRGFILNGAHAKFGVSCTILP